MNVKCNRISNNAIMWCAYTHTHTHDIHLIIKMEMIWALFKLRLAIQSLLDSSRFWIQQENHSLHQLLKSNLASLASRSTRFSQKIGSQRSLTFVVRLWLRHWLQETLWAHHDTIRWCANWKFLVSRTFKLISWLGCCQAKIFLVGKFKANNSVPYLFEANGKVFDAKQTASVFRRQKKEIISVARTYYLNQKQWRITFHPLSLALKTSVSNVELFVALHYKCSRRMSVFALIISRTLHLVFQSHSCDPQASDE